MRNTRLLSAGRSIAVIAATLSVLLVLTAFVTRAVKSTAFGDDASNASKDKNSELLMAARGEFRFKRSEKCFMRRINRIRARNGLGSLRWDRHLGVVGRRHARSMSRAGGIWHDDISRKVTRWRSLGQNTGMGGGCKRMTRAFMHSAGHRANYLGRWRYVGVGVVRRNGTSYVQQVFESRRDPGNIWSTP